MFPDLKIVDVGIGTDGCVILSRLVGIKGVGFVMVTVYICSGIKWTLKVFSHTNFPPHTHIHTHVDVRIRIYIKRCIFVKLHIHPYMYTYTVIYTEL